MEKVSTSPPFASNAPNYIVVYREPEGGFLHPGDDIIFGGDDTLTIPGLTLVPINRP